MNEGRMPFGACGPFLLVLALAACSDRSSPSADENRQLDNAAEMLDSAPGELSRLDDDPLASSDDNSIDSNQVDD